jgi:two-component system, NarL family, sensor kinase
MRSILLVILLFLSFVLIAQTKIDSLKKVIATTKIDTTKVWTLIALGNELENAQPNEAYKYYKDAEAISRRINYPVGILKSISNFTYILDIKSDFKTSFKYYTEAVALSKKYKLPYYEGGALANLGTWYYRNGDLSKTVKYYNEATTVMDKIQNDKFSLMLKANTTNIYQKLNRHDDCIKLCNEVIEKTKNKPEYATTLIQVLINKGNSITDQEKWKESIPVFEEALKISNKYEYKEGIASAVGNLSNAYRRTNQISKSYEYAKKMLPLVLEIDDKAGIRSAYYNIGNYYFVMGNRDSTEKYFNKSMEAALANNIKDELEENYYGMANISLWKGNVKDYIKYAALADSTEAAMQGEIVLKNTSEIEAKYNLQKKENEILQKDLQIQQSQNRQWLLGGGFLLLIVLGGLGFYSFRKNQIAKNLEAKLQAQNKERQRISREMHDDLGGNLTSLIYTAHLLNTKYPDNEQVKKITILSDDISETINEIVWSLNIQQNSLADWAFYTKGKVSELLENSNLDFKFQIPETIPQRILSDEQKRNLYLVVKESVNNAIKHSEAKNLLIKMDFDNSLLHRGRVGDGVFIQIQDDGVGFNDATKTKTGSGNGLSNMKARMEEIGGEISWKNENGTLVEITCT